MKIQTLRPRIAAVCTQTANAPAKTTDPYYLTPEHRAWRETVIARAGGRCEYRDEYGNRCAKAEPRHRMFADHVIELSDGGGRLDTANGQCLCGQHHALKTHAAAAARLQMRG